MSAGKTKPKKLVSPFEGGPRTTVSQNAAGEAVITVKIKELTPLRAISARNVAGLIAVSIMCAPVVPIYEGRVDGILFLIACTFAVIVWWPLYLLLKYLFRKKTVVKFTPSIFQVRKWYGWKNYDRTLPHRFVLMSHDKTEEEQRDHAIMIHNAQRAGHNIKPKRYYSDSYHVVFEYAGHRHDVASVYRKKRAMAVFARLNACDEVMNSIGGMSGGMAMTPGTEWGDQPGALPKA